MYIVFDLLLCLVSRGADNKLKLVFKRLWLKPRFSETLKIIQINKCKNIFSSFPCFLFHVMSHLNLRAGSIFPVPVCTVSPGLWVNEADTQQDYPVCNKVDAVRLYASYRCRLILLKGQRCVTCPLKFRFLTNLDICLSACGARFLGLKVYKQQCKIENKIILLMFQISLTYSTRWKTNFPSPNSQIQSYPQKLRPQNISICCDQRFKFSCFNQTSLFSKNHNLRRFV